MSKLIILSEAQFGGLESEAIRIVLAEPDNMPASIIIHWPAERSTVDRLKTP
jgi:hypothetical protein